VHRKGGAGGSRYSTRNNPRRTSSQTGHTLDADTAANAVEDRVGALEARAAEIMALQKVGATATAACAAACHYLLAALQAEVSRLEGFATVSRSGRLQYRQTADPETGSRDAVGKMTGI
jgi:hypothetical protein